MRLDVPTRDRITRILCIWFLPLFHIIEFAVYFLELDPSLTSKDLVVAHFTAHTAVIMLAILLTFRDLRRVIPSAPSMRFALRIFGVEFLVWFVVDGAAYSATAPHGPR